MSNPKVRVGPMQSLWDPLPKPQDGEKVDFIDGLKTILGAGEPSLNEGHAIHPYSANASMDKRAFMNSDGEMLIIPQSGRLDIQTELGK